MEFVYNFIRVLFEIFTFLIIARAIISWFPLRYDNPILRILNQLTEPLLAPLRRVIPRLGMIDITPLVAIILLQLVSALIP